MAILDELLQESYHYGSSPFKDISRNEHLRTFLFGYPISHSLAPVLHSTVWRRLNLPWTYTLVESLTKDDFTPILQSKEFIGAAVTMPHKIAMLDSVDGHMESASVIGAINTIFVRCDDTGNRKRIGANTDCIGIYEAVQRSFPGGSSEIKCSPGLVVGGGGACRSAVYALWKYFGVQAIYLVNREPGEVERVISSMSAAGVTAKLTHIQSVEQAEGCRGVVSIIGAIPDIPPTTEAERTVQQILLEFLRKEQKGYLVDMCYHPRPLTRLVQSGREHGWNVTLGTEPLIYQAIAQQVLWLEMNVSNSIVTEVSNMVRGEAVSRFQDLEV